MERVVSALGLSDVSKHQRPPKVIGSYAYTKLRLAKSPVGMIGQADAISDAGEHSGFRNVVVDDHRHAGQASAPLERKEARLKSSAYIVQVGEELLDSTGHHATLTIKHL